MHFGRLSWVKTGETIQPQILHLTSELSSEEIRRYANVQL